MGPPDNNNSIQSPGLRLRHDASTMTRIQHRTRRPRSNNGTLDLLDQWRRRVERVERRVAFESSRPTSNFDTYPAIVAGPTGCPACDGPFTGNGTRDRLERIMRGNSRKAHRLRAAGTHLDERYRAATVEVDAPAGLQWWDRRLPWV